MRTVSSNFRGVNFPPGTKVSFETKGKVFSGVVVKLLTRQARVMLPNKTTYKVPYSLLNHLEPVNGVISLPEITKIAKDLLVEHNLSNWEFAFDLAENRSGVCYYDRKLIRLSVTYCIKATMDEIINTLLHEIAHALVGPNHGHDSVWRRKAQSIGCSGERCHYVKHTQPKYIGTCLCPKMKWERHRLTKKARTGYCPRCLENVSWKLNTEF